MSLQRCREKILLSVNAKEEGLDNNKERHEYDLLVSRFQFQIPSKIHKRNRKIIYNIAEHESFLLSFKESHYVFWVSVS